MVTIVIHGGAGTISGDERRRLAAEGTDKAARIGHDILTSGGTAIEAVKRAVMTMEELPQFNAGFGSVITEEQTIEMDALLVDGQTGDMGGVLGVSKIKNPILLSELIMNESFHLLFAGTGAEKFAVDHGMELIEPIELITERVRERYQNWKASREQDKSDPEGRDKYGTVGAVAIDQEGRLAAATSTGGTLGKQVGRIGDTPMFGAGTYADREVAISATGVGEYIIQSMIGMKIKFLTQKLGLTEATHVALDEANERFGPMGTICLDQDENWSAMNTTKDLAYSYISDNERGNFLTDD